MALNLQRKYSLAVLTLKNHEAPFYLLFSLYWGNICVSWAKLTTWSYTYPG